MLNKCSIPWCLSTRGVCPAAVIFDSRLGPWKAGLWLCTEHQEIVAHEQDCSGLCNGTMPCNKLRARRYGGERCGRPGCGIAGYRGMGTGLDGVPSHTACWDHYWAAVLVPEGDLALPPSIKRRNAPWDF